MKIGLTSVRARGSSKIDGMVTGDTIDSKHGSLWKAPRPPEPPAVPPLIQPNQRSQPDGATGRSMATVGLYAGAGGGGGGAAPAAGGGTSSGGPEVRCVLGAGTGGAGGTGSG